MKFSFDQHAGHRAPLSRTSSRQAGHSGGRPISRNDRAAAPSAARSGRAALSFAQRAVGAIDVVAAIGSSYAQADASSISSAADLKFLQRLSQTRIGTSNRKAALETETCSCPFASEVRVRGVLPCITNFGSGALAALLRGPAAGTHAVAYATPRAFTPTIAEAAGPAGALAAAAHRHAHGAVARHTAEHVEVGLARIGHLPVGNAHRIAIGTIARTVVGDDEHAPRAVEGGLRSRRKRNRDKRGGCDEESKNGAARGHIGRQNHLNLGVLLSRLSS